MIEKNAEISARVRQVIDLLHTNPNKLANALGYSRAQTIYDIINGKAAPSYDFFKRFLASGYAAFINLHWLISGEGSPIFEETYYQSDLPIIKGEMTTEQAEQKLKEIRNKRENVQYNTEYSVCKESSQNINSKLNPWLVVKDKMTAGAIPLVSEKAVGGFANEHFSIRENDVLEYYVIPKFRYLNVDFMIELTGDSMMPHLYPGDIIACSIIHNSNFIQWNKPHLLATREQGLIVKRLRKSPDPNCLLAVSDNHDYDPIDIPKDEILGIARVVGVIHPE